MNDTRNFLYYTTITSLLFFSCSPILQSPSITKVVTYNKFLINGSTGGIIYAFNFPNERKIDTSQSNLIKFHTQYFETVLKGSRIKRHHQQKLGGATLAGEFYDNLNKKHFFVYYEYSKLLIDFTDKIEYWLKDKLVYKS